MAIQIGSLVRCKDPWDVQFPGEHVVEDAAEAPDTWKILGGIDFHVSHLEEVV